MPSWLNFIHECDYVGQKSVTASHLIPSESADYFFFLGPATCHILKLKCHAELRLFSKSQALEVHIDQLTFFVKCPPPIPLKVYLKYTFLQSCPQKIAKALQHLCN